jgi:hypothetical protein
MTGFREFASPLDDCLLRIWVESVVDHMLEMLGFYVD